MLGYYKRNDYATDECSGTVGKLLLYRAKEPSSSLA